MNNFYYCGPTRSELNWLQYENFFKNEKNTQQINETHSKKDYMILQWRISSRSWQSSSLILSSKTRSWKGIIMLSIRNFQRGIFHQSSQKTLNSVTDICFWDETQYFSIDLKLLHYLISNILLHAYKSWWVILFFHHHNCP